MAPGRARGGAIDEYPAPATLRKIELRRARITRMLGLDIPDADVERILKGLGFQVRKGALGWDVAAPTFRVDVLREVDLIEEVARHYGYDRLPSTFPALARRPRRPIPPSSAIGSCAGCSLAAGCSEALTFSFIDAAAAAPFADAQTIVPIENPLSAQFSVLRPSLLPGLLASVAHNRHRERTDVRLFELGASDDARRRVSARRRGADRQGASAHWSAGHRPVDFFDAKGIVERIADALQVDVTFDGATVPSVSRPRTRGRRSSSADASVGSVGMLTPAIVASAGLSTNEDVYVAELDLDALTASQSPAPLTVDAASALSRPSRATSRSSSTRPCPRKRFVALSVRLRPTRSSRCASSIGIKARACPNGRVSLSLRLTFRSLERTLTDAEVQTAMNEILTALKNAHDAVQR